MTVSLVKGLLSQENWPSWKVFKVHVADYKSIPCLVEDLSVESIVKKGLPTEFFNHELAEVDALDEQSIVEFVETWGIPHNPFFGSWASFLSYRSQKSQTKDLLSRTQDLAAIESHFITEACSEHFDDRWWGKHEEKLFWPNEAKAVAKSRYVQTHRRHKTGEGGVIALEEVRRSIINLQEITRVMSYIDGIDGEDETLARIAADYKNGYPTVSPYIKTIGEGLRVFEKLLGWSAEAGRYLTGCLEPLTWSLVDVCSTRAPERPSSIPCEVAASFGLTEAIAIQFYYELCDGNPWQTCRYEPCNRWFKYQRQNTQPHYLTPNKRGGTGFCCKSHSVMENRRLNNAAEKAAKECLLSGSSKEDALKQLAKAYTPAQIERALNKAYSVD